MPSFVYDTCCGCIDVRTGSFIIGYVHLVGEIILVLGGLFFFVVGGVVVADKNTEHDGKAIGLALIILAAILLIFVVILMAFTITLLVGLHKNKRGHVKAFLIYYAIFIVIYAICFIASLFSASKISTTISTLFEILLMLYFFLVIRSQYHKMDDTNKGVIYRTA